MAVRSHCGRRADPRWRTPLALSRYGSDELRKEFLGAASSGRLRRLDSAGRETCAGSDVGSIKTEARRGRGDGVINGGKMWTTTGAQATDVA